MTMKLIKTLLQTVTALLFISVALSLSAGESIPKDEGALGVADQLMLKTGSEEILSLYRPVQSSRSDGGVILLHDRGTQPDWPGVIQTLRRGLPRYGWSTLAIKLPALEAGVQTSPQVLKQWSESVPVAIDAAIMVLEARNISNIVLIGHGSGALVAADYMTKKPHEKIRGLIAVGMDGSKVADESLDGALLLRRLDKVIFDIYGSRDLQSVVRSAIRRATMATTAEPGKTPQHIRAAAIARNFNSESALQISYRQHRIEGADHQFRGYEKQLLNRVVGWLRRYAGIVSK